MFARVVFLYAVDNGEQKYFYTNANRDLLYDDNLYRAVPVSHDALEHDSDEVTKSKCSVKISVQTDYIQSILKQYDAYLTTLKILRYYVATGDVETEFIGTLSTIEFSVKEATLSFTNVLYDTQRGAMRLIYQRQCPFALYGEQCKVNKEDHAHISYVSNWTRLDDYRLKSTASLPDNIDGGIISMPNKALFFIRMVDYENNIITVSRPVYASYLQPVDGYATVMVYQGCDRTIETCRNRFNNDDNYGGFTLLPLENPTERNPLAQTNLKDNAQLMRDYVNEQKNG